MAILNSSIAIDGTVGMTGGTATSWVLKEYVNPNGVVVLLDDSSEFIAQTTALWTHVSPKVRTGAPNGYTQQRNNVVVHKPLALDNGEFTKNGLKLELFCDHETTDAEIESLLVIGAQLFSDSDFSDFWKKQSMA